MSSCTLPTADLRPPLGIDWNDVTLFEKIDGILVTLYKYKDKWMVASKDTPGTAVFMIQLNIKMEVKTFIDPITPNAAIVLIYTLPQKQHRNQRLSVNDFGRCGNLNGTNYQVLANLYLLTQR